MKSFVTDFCSGWVSLLLRQFGIKLQPFETCCCVPHDWEYFEGGTRADRLRADRAFRACLIRQGVKPWLAGLMFWAVRFGGAPYWPVGWRWAYGRRKWGYDRPGDRQAR